MGAKAGVKSAFCAVALLGTSPALATPTLVTLATFNGTNGANPFAGLIADAAGNLYGTTSNGGASGYGTVFEVAGASHSLGTLAGFNYTNGASPVANLVADSAGNLYGTTSRGGPGGQGTVFEVAVGGHALSTVVAFNYTNGASPNAGLIADAAGNLYGTTSQGGANSHGTAFEVAAGTHVLGTLAAFNGTNGDSPRAGLITDAAGNLYGTTYLGGSNLDGTVFEVAAGNPTPLTLATFNGTNGYQPEGDLIADATGNLYGTTNSGGGGTNGTVFEVATGSRTLSSLALFSGANGSQPRAGLIADAAGNLYGTTSGGGGSSGYGTVFELASGSHTPTTLAVFTGSNGQSPNGNLIADAAGNLYGTTASGGVSNDGVVFELSGTGFVPPPVVVAGGQAYHFAANTGTGILVRTVAGLNVAATGVAVVDLAQSRTNRQLLVVNGTGLVLAGPANQSTGLLNLTNNDLDLACGDLATATRQVAQGYANGTWAGTGGIASTAAAADPSHLTTVGVVQNNQSGSALYTATNPFDGTTPGAGDILVKYTYYGDANLDGVVNGQDYTRIDAGYASRGTATPPTGWYNGDFNYDGKVDGSDYTLIDNAFDLQATSPVAASTAEVAAVPEPVSVGVAVVAAAALFGRRQRR